MMRDSENNAKYRVYAVVAPSISSQFSYAKTGQVVTGLKKLGFHSVVEAALGADMVAYDEAAELAEKGFLTSYEKEIGGKIRKYYSITDAGKKHLIQKKKEWNEYSQAVAGILTFSAEGV